MVDNSHINWIEDQGGILIHNDNLPSRLAALVYRTTDWLNFGSSSIAIPWEAAEYDIGDWFDAGDPTKLTVPSGVSRIQLQTNVYTDNGSGTMAVFMQKNGGSFVGRPFHYNNSVNNEAYNLTTPEINVVPGDYFEVWVNVNSTIRDIIANDYSWFSIKAIEL